MTIHALAGKPAPKELLLDIDKLRKEYYTRKPGITNTAERVSFGTSGHRGSWPASGRFTTGPSATARPPWASTALPWKAKWPPETARETQGIF